MSLLKSFNCRKRGMGYARVIHKKEKERKSIEKNRQVSKISKTMGTQIPSMKNKER
jgi:hypothetical protein